MADNVYNGRRAHTEVIEAGTRLFRIAPAGAVYRPNSFNPSPRPLDDELQGRFEPYTADLGGYLYVASTISGAVAEGVLRNQRVSASGFVPRLWLRDRVLVSLVLEESISVACVDGPHAAVVNLDASVLGSSRDRYSECRAIATAILRNDPSVRGLRFSARNNAVETAIVLVTRGGPGPRLRVEAEHHILDDPVGFDAVIGVLRSEYGLFYAGTGPR